MYWYKLNHKTIYIIVKISYTLANYIIKVTRVYKYFSNNDTVMQKAFCIMNTFTFDALSMST